MYKTAISVIALCLIQAACSSEQLYATGRQAQRNECMKEADQTNRARCLKDAGMSHDAYEKESEAARNLATKPN